MSHIVKVDMANIAERLTGERVKSAEKTTEGDLDVFSFVTTWFPDYPSNEMRVIIKIDPHGRYNAFADLKGDGNLDSPFSVGSLSDIWGENIRLRASVKITVADWEEFTNDFFIEGDFKADEDLKAAMEKTYKDALIKTQRQLGFTGYHFHSLSRDGDDMHFIVEAIATDVKKLTRQAREVAINAGFGDDFLPTDPNGAFCVLGVTDTDIDPANSFEYIDYTEQQGVAQRKNPELDQPIYKAF